MVCYCIYYFSYSLTGTSDFTIDDSSGLLRTNVIFSGRVGQLLKFSVSASDQAEADSKTSSETVFVSVIDNQYLIQIVVDQTIENTRLCLDQLVNKLILLTNYQVLT
ncbi:hypothetical protein LOD99_15924 [Oopsacas minuta]|uniref:Uncharacterized protein n=1 Tax=Oopsacas minuta TaxID=111878 RepID=A0AAV7K7M5_9METZ|nr:hypothetical protein LOD99_15924 [Oopsacas minuta]